MLPSLFDLTGRTAIVTGGAGRLGSEYVRTLREAGARVASIDIRHSTPAAGTCRRAGHRRRHRRSRGGHRRRRSRRPRAGYAGHPRQQRRDGLVAGRCRARDRPLRGLPGSGVGHDDRLPPQGHLLRLAGLHPRVSPGLRPRRQHHQRVVHLRRGHAGPIALRLSPARRRGLLQAGRLQRGQVRRAELHALAGGVPAGRSASASTRWSPAASAKTATPRSSSANTKSAPRWAGWRSRATTTARSCFSPHAPRRT